MEEENNMSEKNDGSDEDNDDESVKIVEDSDGIIFGKDDNEDDDDTEDDDDDDDDDDNELKDDNDDSGDDDNESGGNSNAASSSDDSSVEMKKPARSGGKKKTVQDKKNKKKAKTSSLKKSKNKRCKDDVDDDLVDSDDSEDDDADGSKKNDAMDVSDDASSTKKAPRSAGKKKAAGSKGIKTKNAKGGGSKKSESKSTKKKGKKEDSDAESDDLFAGENIMDQLHKYAQASSNSRKLDAFVSGVLRNEKTQMSSVVVCMGPKGSTFFNKAKNIRLMLALMQDDLVWVDTLVDFIPRRQEHGDNSFKRSSKGKTSEQMMFVVTVFSNKEKTIHDEVGKCLNSLKKTFKKREHNRCGEMTMTCWKDSGMYDGLINWATNKCGTEDKAINLLNESLENYYKFGFQMTFDNHLDRFLTDYDIKTFLETHFAALSWDDVSTSVKKVCYKHYPQQKLPDWHDIVQESI